MAPQTSLQSYPPHRLLKNRVVSATEAQGLLSSYIEMTLTSPHLHPDAVLSPAGIQFSPHGGSQGGLALHNLRRVEAGLRGERLAPDTAEMLQKFEAKPTEEDEWKPKKKRRTEIVDNKKDTNAVTEEGWQDPEEYMRQQAAEGDDDVDMEGGARSTFAGQGTEPPEVVADTQVDKDARKKSKKEKKKEQQREKNAKKREAAEAE